jgi:hypothetical protein
MHYFLKELPEDSHQLVEGWTYYIPSGLRQWLKGSNLPTAESAVCIRSRKDRETITLIKRNHLTSEVKVEVREMEAQEPAFKCFVNGKKERFSFNLEEALGWVRNCGKVEKADWGFGSAKREKGYSIKVSKKKLTELSLADL